MTKKDRLWAIQKKTPLVQSPLSREKGRYFTSLPSVLGNANEISLKWFGCKHSDSEI